MPRRTCTSAAAVVCFAVLGAPVRAQEAAGRLGSAPLPGGLRAALAVLHDTVPADHAHFLPELIRRTQQRPRGLKVDELDPRLLPLLDHLERAAREAEAAGHAEDLPLPLGLDTWNKSVFPAPVAPQDFVRALLQSRDASLLYAGLLALDDSTRAWLETEPALLAEIASRHAPAFLLASPGLRVAGRALIPPGGSVAEPSWRALVGEPADRPVAFIRSLLARDEGRLAYFFGEMAQLQPRHLDVVFGLSAADSGARLAMARRVYAVYGRLVADWRIAERTFWRPRWDPGTLVRELGVDERGHPFIPGTRRFWTSVFASPQKHRPPGGAPAPLVEGDTADFVWLAEQVFHANAAEQERRYFMALYASRAIDPITAQTAFDAVDTVRAASAFPALTATLERAGLTDLQALGAAARRAARLSSIGDVSRAGRALTQFQGALFLVVRAATKGSIARSDLPALVSSLSAVEPGNRGDYEGGLVVWLDTHLRGAASSVIPSGDASGSGNGGDREDDLLGLLSGPPDRSPRFVEWEGTRYRVDLPRGELARIRRLLEPETDACLSSARTLVRVADIVSAPRVRPAVLAREADTLEDVAEAIGLEDQTRWARTDVPARFRGAVDSLQQAARGRTPHDAAQLASSLRLLADDLLARGLLELVYVVSLGHPEVTSVTPGAIASRHDLGRGTPIAGRLRPWQLPATAAEAVEGRQVVGSLLGLDVALADFSLRRISWKPPARKPALDPESRRVFVETIALVEAARLTDADRRAIAGALRRGRHRLSQASTGDDAMRLAEDAGLSATRRSLLAWSVAQGPGQREAFLSTRELFWLGYEGERLDRRFDGWGVSKSPRSGCLCLELFGRDPWEVLAGRWHAGVLASAVPDLSLRLAELLDELDMPASLLGPVLAAAATDFINTAESRDRDDYRGLVAVIPTLTADRVEEYLALLTTDGPLVPVSGSAARSRLEEAP